MGKEGKKSKEKDREKISKKKAADGDKEHGKKAKREKDGHKRVTGSLDGENRPNNAVRPPKKQKNGKGVVTVHEGANGIVAAERKAKNEAWNPKIEGQKFGEWSKDEKEELDARIKEWAMAHGKIDDYNNKKFDFLMQRRQKQGGRGAKLPDSERKAFLEIATGFPTRNPKQIYGYVSRHYDSDNYKGKWSDEEKKKLTDLVAEYGEKWKEVGKNLGRPGHACRDKWRMMRNNPKSGDWSPAEVAHLRELVNEYFAQNNAAPGEKLFYQINIGVELSRYLGNFLWCIHVILVELFNFVRSRQSAMVTVIQCLVWLYGYRKRFDAFLLSLI